MFMVLKNIFPEKVLARKTLRRINDGFYFGITFLVRFIDAVYEKSAFEDRLMSACKALVINLGR